jgi:REP element-mobilizing transposase RayT
VRDHKELMRIVNYVLNNPVKAGLSEKWEDWKWSYCNFELLG